MKLKYDLQTNILDITLDDMTSKPMDDDQVGQFVLHLSEKGSRTVYIEVLNASAFLAGMKKVMGEE